MYIWVLWTVGERFFLELFWMYSEMELVFIVGKRFKAMVLLLFHACGLRSFAKRAERGMGSEHGW